MSRRVLARPLAAATLASALVLTAPLAAATGGDRHDGHDRGKDRHSRTDGDQRRGHERHDRDRHGDKRSDRGERDQHGRDEHADGRGGKHQAKEGSKHGSKRGSKHGSQQGEARTKGKDRSTQHGKDKDPAGNNGTVKIAPYGEMDRIPNNTPHVGCTFQVEWYGYDRGEDVVSSVSFAMHSPTADVALTVDGPSRVFVGGDAASGAGTETGLDGREVYTLSFDGDPHPKQGYHVKLTVATPRSQGNDTKTKVFWVQECAASLSAADADADADAGAGDATAATGSDVPSAVDAGAQGEGLQRAADLARSQWALLLLVLGLALGTGAVVVRRAGR